MDSHVLDLYTESIMARVIFVNFGILITTFFFYDSGIFFANIYYCP